MYAFMWIMLQDWLPTHHEVWGDTCVAAAGHEVAECAFPPLRRPLCPHSPTEVVTPHGHSSLFFHPNRPHTWLWCFLPFFVLRFVLFLFVSFFFFALLASACGGWERRENSGMIMCSDVVCASCAILFLWRKTKKKICSGWLLFPPGRQYSWLPPTQSDAQPISANDLYIVGDFNTFMLAAPIFQRVWIFIYAT